MKRALHAGSRAPYARQDSETHMGFGDWSDTELLFRRLDLGTCSDARFNLFLAETVHPLAVDQEESMGRVEMFNRHLSADGRCIEQVRELSG